MRAAVSGINGWRSFGFILVIAGFGWLIASILLRNFYPLRWGGPNIGGGLLVLLAGLAILAGLILIAIEIPLHWRGGRARLSVMDRIGVAVSVLLAATFVAVGIVQPGDPSAGINGQVGVTVSTSGSPVLILQICRGSIDHLTISGPHRRSEPNEQLARFDAARPAGVGGLVFDLQHPPDGWTQAPGSILAVADPAKLKIVIGNGPKNELRQVAFTDAELESLDSRTVLYSGSSGRSRMPLASFAVYACR